MSIKFAVPIIPPSVNRCWRRKRGGGYYMAAEAKAFIDAVALFCGHHGEPVKGHEYHVVLRFYVPSKRYLRIDLDNLCKIAIDSIAKAGLISDDRYIVSIQAAKWIGAETTEFEITSYESRFAKAQTANG